MLRQILQVLTMVLMVAALFLMGSGYGLHLSLLGFFACMATCNHSTLGVFCLLFGRPVLGYLAVLYGYAGWGGDIIVAIGLVLLYFRCPLQKAIGESRSIKPLLEALVNVISERSDFAATFNICLAGSGQGFEDALVFAEANNISNQLSFLGVLSPDAVNRTLGVSHALIIVQPNECDRQVPGKIFESLKTGKPIIGLMPKDCEAADILRSSGLGIIHEANDNEGLRDSLIRLWDAWRIGESVVSPNWAVIEDFSLSRLPVKIKRVIEGFVDMTDTIGSG